MCHHLYCRVKDQRSSIAIIYGFVTPNFLCGRMTAKTTRSWLEPKDAYYDCMHAITSDCSSFRCSLLKLLNMDDDASKLSNISSKMLIVAWPCVYSSSPLHTEFIFCRYGRRSLCRIDTQCTATHVVLHGPIGQDVGTVPHLPAQHHTIRLLPQRRLDQDCARLAYKRHASPILGRQVALCGSSTGTDRDHADCKR